MDCQKEEWNGFIKDWDASVYEKRIKLLTFIEKIATLFRWKVKQRQDVTLSLLNEYIKGRSFFEFGCGCGRLGEALLEREAAHYTGVDITPEGIKEAKQRLSKFDSSKYTLYCMDIANMKDFKNDEKIIYCGLGIIQYLSEEELKTMFKIIGKSQFIFETHEFRFNFMTLAFVIYRMIRRHSYYKFVKKSKIKKIMENPETLQYKRIQGLSFVYHL